MPASSPPVVGAQHLHGQHAGGIVGGGERMRRAEAAGDHGDRALVGEPRERADEFAGAPGIDAVGEPDHLDVAGPGRGSARAPAAPRRARRVWGFGLIRRSRAGGAGGLQRNVAVGVRQRHERDAAAVGLGAGDEILGGADARVPARGGGPAVVDQDQQRRAAVRGRDRRIPQRPGGGEDDQRRERQPQQRQPPRRARRRLFLRRDVEQQARRRKIDRGAAAAAPAAAATTAPAG